MYPYKPMPLVAPILVGEGSCGGKMSGTSAPKFQLQTMVVFLPCPAPASYI